MGDAVTVAVASAVVAPVGVPNAAMIAPDNQVEPGIVSRKDRIFRMQVFHSCFSVIKLSPKRF